MPTTGNCLAGIKRETVLELAAELKIPTEETILQPYDRYTAEELFFTSIPYCIMPATKFNGLSVGEGKVGPVTKQLLSGWSEQVGVDIVAQGQNQLADSGGSD
jgi:branched-chain amino acid aminotransferase